MIDDPLNRLKVKRGEDLPQAKLTEDQVKEVRQIYATARREIMRLQSQFSAAGLAKRYGVHKRTMDKILRGETWSHLPTDLDMPEEQTA